MFLLDVCLIFRQSLVSFDPIYLGTTFNEVACLPFLLAAEAHSMLWRWMTSHKLPLWRADSLSFHFLSMCNNLEDGWWNCTVVEFLALALKRLLDMTFLRESIPAWVTGKENFFLVLRFLSNCMEEICKNQTHLWLYEDLWLFQYVFFI